MAGPGGAPLLPAELYLQGADKPKGRLTSWGWHPKEGGVGLALVHRTVAPDAPLACGDGRRLEMRAG